MGLHYSMKDCEEHIEFMAKDLLDEYSFFNVTESGKGFYVVNSIADTVEGPFKTLHEAHVLLADKWSKISESSNIYK